jgi:TrmH family RNA methyltransferase
MSFCVVLVEPEHQHNIGFCARAMRSNGLTDLRVVSARGHIPKGAWDTAHASAEILDQAKIVSSVSEAIADCQTAVAFSRRVFDSVLTHLSLPELGAYPGITREKVALVFGRESKGLSAEEIALCSIQCEIPVAGNMSVNLAQAVAVVLYELCREGLLTDRPTLAKRNRIRPMHRTPAPGHAQWEALVQFLCGHLDGRYGRGGQHFDESAIRKWLHRLAPDQLELRALFGVVRNLAGSNSRKEKPAE